MSLTIPPPPNTHNNKYENESLLLQYTADFLRFSSDTENESLFVLVVNKCKNKQYINK